MRMFASIKWISPSLYPSVYALSLSLYIYRGQLLEINIKMTHFQIKLYVQVSHRLHIQELLKKKSLNLCLPMIIPYSDILSCQFIYIHCKNCLNRDS